MHEQNEDKAPTSRRSLLEDANGNYLLAVSRYFEGLPVSPLAKKVLKGVLIGVAVLFALCTLCWPLWLPLL